MLKLFNRKKKQAWVPETDEEEVVEPLHVSDEDFEEKILNASEPAVVDFWSEYCSPCHVMAYVMEDLAGEFEDRAVVAKLRVDDNPETPSKYNIMGVPTMIFFKDGVEVDRVVGVTTFSNMKEHLEALL